jgi:alanine racemase
MKMGLLITVGDEAATIAQAAVAAGLPDSRVVRTRDAAECAAALDHHLRQGDVVLVKASRPLRLEQTAEHLLESLSPTRLYVDLGVVAENVRRVRAWTGTGVGLFAVVKSFGYGADAVRVSEQLERLGVDYLAVAYPDEGALLRRRGIQAPILVFNVTLHEADKIVAHRLSAVVHSVDLIHRLQSLAARSSATIPVHLKVDTGMARFGVRADEVEEVAQLVADQPNLVLEGLMSHLAAADDPDQDEFTRRQITAFRSAVSCLGGLGLRPRFIHLANSAGILRFPEAHFNAVRLGLGLYASAMALHSRVVGIREIDAGDTVGYGRSYTASEPMRIGLVGLGYNDGLPWAVSNKGGLWIREKRAPIVGNVCMDVTMVDLSDIPDARVGDDVVVWGDGAKGFPTIEEVATLAGTIPYEILCRVSPRVQRIMQLA